MSALYKELFSIFDSTRFPISEKFNADPNNSENFLASTNFAIVSDFYSNRSNFNGFENLHKKLSQCGADLPAICTGIAYFRKYILKLPENSNEVICLIDGQYLTEGAVTEAINFANRYDLSNFTLIALNTAPATDSYFDFKSLNDKAVNSNSSSTSPRFFTFNFDVSFENTTPSIDSGSLEAPVTPSKISFEDADLLKFDKFKENCSVREAYGVSLCELYEKTDGKVIVLDADVKNSTFSILFANKHKENFIECFISEQLLVSVGTGVDLACKGEYYVFCSTFATFFNRAANQIKNAILLGSNLNMSGSHIGASIGHDGPSQMGIEDMSLFESLKNLLTQSNITVFYPSDAKLCLKAVFESAKRRGVCFIRSSRSNMPIIYDELYSDNKFGSLYVLNKIDSPESILIASGTSLHHSLAIKDDLKAKKVLIVDPYCIDPLDSESLRKLISTHSVSLKSIIVVEDHYKAGGIGHRIKDTLMSDSANKRLDFHHLCVKDIPRSGKPSELERLFEIDSTAILGVL